MDLELVPAVHGRDARARRLPGLGLVQGAFAPLPALRRGRGDGARRGSRLAGRTVALLATTIVLCQPFTLWVGTSTFVEPAPRSPSRSRWRTSCTSCAAARNRGARADRAFAGAAAGMKYVAAGAAAVLALGALVRCGDRLTVRRFAFGVPALAVALPWYVKNAILTGNPVYPIFFGWDNEEERAAAWASFDNYGHGHSPLDLVLLLPRLLADAELVRPRRVTSPAPLLFAPLALLDPRARRFAGLTLACVAAYVLVWFFGVAARALPAARAPVLAVLAAVGIVSIARQGKLGRMVAIVGSVTTFAVGGPRHGRVRSAVRPVSRRAPERGDVPAREHVVLRGVAWLNANLPPDSRVVVDHVVRAALRAGRADWTSDVLRTNAGPAETREFVRRYGVTHAVVFEASTNRCRDSSRTSARAGSGVCWHDRSSRARSARSARRSGWSSTSSRGCAELAPRGRRRRRPTLRA